MTLALAKILRDAGPWGQQFPVPSFHGAFKVLDQRVLTGKHLKFVLKAKGSHSPVDAIMFFADEQQLKSNFQSIKIHYEMSVNAFRGQESLQLMILSIVD